MFRPRDGMRIIAGLAKGMTLAAPHTGGVRPTSDRIREAIFSSLGHRVVGATVLDLFAGTGALGLEAASRGGRAVTFVESAPAVLGTLRENIEAFRRCRADVSLTVIRADALRQVRKMAAARETFALVVADPPYGPFAQALLAEPAAAGLLTDGGILVLESGKRSPLDVPPTWSLRRETVHGDTRVSFLETV